MGLLEDILNGKFVTESDLKFLNIHSSVLLVENQGKSYSYGKMLFKVVLIDGTEYEVYLRD